MFSETVKWQGTKGAKTSWVLSNLLYFGGFYFSGDKGAVRAKLLSRDATPPASLQIFTHLLVCEDGAFDDMQWRIDHHKWRVDVKWECAQCMVG